MNITFYKSGRCALFPFMVSYANKFNKRQGWGNCYGLLFLLLFSCPHFIGFFHYLIKNDNLILVQ